MKTFLNFSILLADGHCQDENVNCGISLLLSLVVSHRCISLCYCFISLFYLILLIVVSHCFMCML